MKRIAVTLLLVAITAQITYSQNNHSVWSVRENGVITEVVGLPFDKSAMDTLPEMQMGFIDGLLVYVAFSEYSAMEPEVELMDNGGELTSYSGIAKRILFRESGVSTSLGPNKFNATVLIGETAEDVFRGLISSDFLQIRQRMPFGNTGIAYTATYDAADFPTYVIEMWEERNTE